MTRTLSPEQTARVSENAHDCQPSPAIDQREYQLFYVLQMKLNTFFSYTI